ncbi:MAG: hypothetical protein QF444_05025 [Phycisphaerales bacterium]|jgi:hypothetical protein|nr:hypothetical protein [Phycisphaerales bacterium]MDP6693672.1 hypothetical protein [Phycisphaerales bacterium]
MKHNLLLTIGGLVLSSGIASGEYIDLHLVEVAVDGGGTVPGTTSWRLYAEFDNANDQLNSVGGSPSSQGVIASANGFYQNVMGGPFGFDINEALYSFFPSLEFDSWVTIGGIASNTTNNNVDTTFFETGGNFYINDGSWSLPQGNPYAFASTVGGMTNFNVLVGQLTTYGSGVESRPWGQLNLSGYDSLGNSWSIDGTPIPAPSAIVLFGVFGTIARRRG